VSAILASRVPAVTDWLLANLPAATGLEVTEIVDGPPTEAQLRRTCVILGDVTMSQDWAALGARNRNEEADLELAIYILGPGQTQTEVNKRAFDVLSDIELYLRANVTAGNNVLWLGVVPTELVKDMGDNARIAWLSATLRFTARI
jgi:hypothetical protein